MAEGKLFVGQVPRAYTEADLTPMFSPYGNIVELSIIRDKMTDTSRGCAFLTYTTREEADAAIAALHNNTTLPGMHSAMQVKYSTSGAAGGPGAAGGGGMPGGGAAASGVYKLFVGMIPKTYTEEELTPLFQDFGEINEVAILRGPDQTSKGCAFVIFKDVGSAVKAITTLDGKIQLEGAPSKLVVKFADSDKGGARAQAAAPAAAAAASMFNPLLGAFGGLDPYGLNPYAAYGYGVVGAPPASTAVPGTPLGSNKEGPPGANLFIFHIPNDWNDTTLYSTFGRFGNLVSCKVITDKMTGLSRGFGFVSYDSVESAQAAIANLNGSSLPGGKRLKVEAKGASTRARPY